MNVNFFAMSWFHVLIIFTASVAPGFAWAAKIVSAFLCVNELSWLFILSTFKELQPGETNKFFAAMGAEIFPASVHVLHNITPS